MYNVSPHCCSQCGYPTKQEINPEFKLKRKRFDVFNTYDGYLIESQRFKDFCLKYYRFYFDILIDKVKDFEVQVDGLTVNGVSVEVAPAYFKTKTQLKYWLFSSINY